MVDTVDLVAVNARISGKLRNCKQPRVVNLINFSECNLPEESVELVSSTTGADNASTDGGSLSDASSATDASTEPLSVLAGPPSDDGCSLGSPPRPATPLASPQEELMQE